MAGERPRLYATEFDTPRAGTISAVLANVTGDVRRATVARVNPELDIRAQSAARVAFERLTWQEAALIRVMSDKHAEVVENDSEGKMHVLGIKSVRAYVPEAEHMALDEAVERLLRRVIDNPNMTDVEMEYAKDLARKMQMEAEGRLEPEPGLGPVVTYEQIVVGDARNSGKRVNPKRRIFSFPRLPRKPRNRR